MKTLDTYVAEQMEDPAFRAEWEAMQPEYEIKRALIEARTGAGLTQKELSDKTGITQGDISKLENGAGNPSIKTLQRLAHGMGMRLQLNFIKAN